MVIKTLAFAFILIPLVFSAAVMADPDDEINLRCLKLSYPEISRLEKDEKGVTWLVFVDGKKIKYSGDGEADVKASMAQIYPPEPARPDTPPGFAPGRIRSYPLLKTLYGENAGEARKGLRSVKLLNKKFSLNEKAAAAFSRAAIDLEKLAARNPGLKEYLKPEGGFYWRNIAGESRLSAHSFGVALDIGVKKSPYWRWSKQRPHPLQATYPREIVEIFEREGFIWGGKWHEYDIMHFEYRPELICKARALYGTGKSGLKP